MLHALTRGEEEIALAYPLAQGADLHAIVAKSPTMFATLKTARGKITEYFGDVPVRLSMEPDPEIRGFSPVLVEIFTPSSMKDAFDRLEHFENEWGLRAWHDETAEICFLLMPG